MNLIYWGLKDNWWKQVYDGRYHSYGPEVFDKGLHNKRRIEPGYYDSIKLACEYASDQLGQINSVESYKKIHQLACGHFSNVHPSVINVDKAKIDHFRDSRTTCYRNLVKDVYEQEDPSQSKARKRHFLFFHSIRTHLIHNHRVESETGSKQELALLSNDCKQQVIEAFSKASSNTGLDVREFLENGNPFYETAIVSTNKVNMQLKRIQERLNLSKPFASLTFNASQIETLVNVHYLYDDPDEIDQILHLLFDDYNKQIQALPNLEERSAEENKYALTLIAEFYQNLEWLHPFFDGQGRADLVQLTKLLVENGFNPPILYMPYLSTFETLETWVSYLEKGIEVWKIEAGSV